MIAYTYQIESISKQVGGKVEAWALESSPW